MGRYGAHSAAMLANQNLLGVRGALREVAKVYGLPPDAHHGVESAFDVVTITATRLQSLAIDPDHGQQERFEHEPGCRTK
jgi:DNA polymerase III alpha subunit